MDVGFLLNQVFRAVSDFSSQFSPSAWLLSVTSAFAALIAVTGALWAARSAYRNASKIQFEEAERYRLRERAAERERIIGVLHALREELIQLWLMMAEDIAKPIETLDPKKKLLPYWPCYQSYFSIFDSNAAEIGLIESETLRTSLVRTFMLAKRLIDQYQNYNRIEDRMTARESQPLGVPADMTYARHAGAFALVATYKSLKASVEESRNLLDAELGLKRQPLPFIDSLGASENGSQ
jgi:hypothetical protein